MSKKIHWLSNAPWSATGYGNQTKVFMPRIRDLGYEMSATAFYGLDGAVLNYDGMSIYPKRHQTYGMDVVAANAQHAGARVVISLMDAWVCNPQAIQKDNIKWVPWFPVDSEPLPGPVKDTVKHAYKRIVFAPFGVRMMEAAGLDCYYVPHGVDTENFKPINKGNKPNYAARERVGLPKDRFIVGMVAANKGNPSRKAFFEQLTAFAGLRQKHSDAFLYLHTYDGVGGFGYPVDLRQLLCDLDLKAGDDYMFCNQHTYNFSFTDKWMSDMYNSLDVLMNVSMGEGFGIPIIEAQASGCPVIIGDWTSMEDFCFSGHQISKADANMFLTGIGAIQYTPHMLAIQDALEAEYNKPSSRKAAREGALIYDADYVTQEYWKPALADIFENLDAEYGKSNLVRFGNFDDETQKEKCEHDFIEVGLFVGGALSIPCRKCGAARIVSQGSESIEEGFFSNELGLEFHEPDGLEWLIMKECAEDYGINELDLDENSVVVDIGAHVGIVSMTLAKTFGCKVHAYEPNPDNFARMVENVHKNGLQDSVILYNYAVTDDGRDVFMNYDPRNSGGHNIYGSEGKQIASVQFDDILADFPHIDLLKIDCEGAEYEFLPTADLSNVKAIRGEFHAGSYKGMGAQLLEKIKETVPNTKVTLL